MKYYLEFSMVYNTYRVYDMSTHKEGEPAKCIGVITSELMDDIIADFLDKKGLGITLKKVKKEGG